MGCYPTEEICEENPGTMALHGRRRFLSTLARFASHRSRIEASKLKPRAFPVGRIAVVAVGTRKWQSGTMNKERESRAHHANNVLRRPFKFSGITSFLAGCFILAALDTKVAAGSLDFGWNASTTPNVAGYEIYFGEAS